MPGVTRAVPFLLSATLIVCLSAAAAAQANRKTLNQVSHLILKSYHLLADEKDTKAARVECEKALVIEKRVGDPFVSATVHVCFGDVADYEGKPEEACREYATALKNFKAVPARHSARRTLETHISVTKGKRLQLACTP